MRFEILEKNYSASEKLKLIIEKKVSRLERYFADFEEKGGEAVVKVVLSEVTSSKYKMEITVALGGTLLRSETMSENQYDNIDLLLPKLEKQIIKLRTKQKDKLKQSSPDDLIYASGLEERAKPKMIARKKTHILKPITAEEAVEELEFLGHDFYAFVDVETGLTNILYIRKDKNYGVLELR